MKTRRVKKAGKKEKKILLMVGTRKGAFLFSSDRGRKRWAVAGPFLKGQEVNCLTLDPRDRRTMFLAAFSEWWGGHLYRSANFGKKWDLSENGLDFRKGFSEGGNPNQPTEQETQGSKLILKKVWKVAVGLKSQPGVMYAGVDPAALFKSEDHGQTWSEVKGLNQHPTRAQWSPGAGGLICHTILSHPTNPQRMWVAISAAGCFRTDDGGETWTPKNKDVLAEFLPNKYPEVGQCVHKMAMHPARPEVLYQQNHCGMYRSDNGGEDWIDIGKGKLPTRFGFPIAVHPRDPKTIFIIPEESDMFRMSLRGQLLVYCSPNEGRSWKKLTNGLPQKNAYCLVLRDALTTDDCADTGIYFGTSTGQIYYSRNAGQKWEMLTATLPPILSLECATV